MLNSSRGYTQCSSLTPTALPAVYQTPLPPAGVSTVGGVTFSGQSQAAACLDVSAQAVNPSGKPLYNADVFGRVYDANGEAAIDDVSVGERGGESVPTGIQGTTTRAVDTTATIAAHAVVGASRHLAVVTHAHSTCGLSSQRVGHLLV